MGDLKKIIILAIAIALGIFLFRIILSLLSSLFAIAMNLIVVAALLFTGVYVYKRFFKS